MSAPELTEHLKRQLEFLRQGSALYDGGYEDIAVKLAVAIRVLAHDTLRSVSLISQMRQPDSLKLLSTSAIIDNSYVHFGGALSAASLKFDEGKIPIAKQAPTLDRYARDHHFLPWREWWEQVVYVLSVGRISRRDIVLAAAHKDGGAHVDASKMPPSYEVLRMGLWHVGYDPATFETPMPLPDVQLADIRQMGYELLNSPDLVALTR
jgi:hypothetical protein